MLNHHNRVPRLHQPIQHMQQFLNILKCRPVVGSSSKYIVCSVDRIDNSFANFTRCASPPDNVEPVDQVDVSQSNFLQCSQFILNRFAAPKNSIASSTVIAKTSAIFLSLYFTSKSRCCIAFHDTHHMSHTCRPRTAFRSSLVPHPDDSHRPPFTLKLNRPPKYPRMRILRH